jgi:hypothetical protein
MAGVMPIILGSGINRVTANITIATNTANYTLDTAKVTTGYDAGKTDAILTVDPGIIVSSGSTGSYALTVDTSWAPGDTVTVVNNGVILGRGGNGGRGGDGQNQPYNIGLPGSAAGPALLVQRAITMNNLNRIAGGGGGGGGAGGLVSQKSFKGGGGGGGGIGIGSGGSGGAGSGGPAPSGGPGTLTSAGTGATGTQGVPAGDGGSYGSSGATGGTSTYAGGSGGSAGACIVGNSNITYTNTGTRNGSIS